MGFSSPVTRRRFFFLLVVWLILYFADALLITDSRSSHCFLVNSQNCGKKGRKKGTRERTSGVLTVCVQKRNTPLFCFSERRIGCLPRCLPPVTLFLFFKRPTPRPRRRRRRRPSHPQPLPYPPSTTLSLPSTFFFFVNFRERRKERKKERMKKLKSKRKLNQK